MNVFKLAPLLLVALFFGCATDSSKNSGEESILPEMQQNTYLSHAKMPQQYGFSVYPTKEGLLMRGKARLHPNHMAGVNFVKGQIPVIEMHGRAKRMKMNALLDTSSPSSWVEFNTSQEFEAVFMGMDEQHFPYRGGYNTGNAPGYAAVISQMRIDQLMIENIPVYVRMAMNSLGPLARGIKVPGVDAVIGYDILSTFEYIQFDFDSEVVKFSSTIPYLPHQDLLMTKAKIKSLNGYGLAVDGAIFGEPTPIILDFAGDYHFARGDIKVSQTRQVSIGDVVYRKVPTLLLPINNTPPRAGRKMLEKYIITICPKLNIVYFERIPE